MGVPIAISVDYDGGTRSAGASHVAATWHAMLRDQGYRDLRQITVPRQSGPVAPYLAEAIIRSAVNDGGTPLLLGGDHSLTWRALRPLTERDGPIDVLHFDAHHDAYPSSGLNHYTVFHHAQRLLPVKMHSVGVRYEGHTADVLDQPITNPCYVTVDVDYFAPHLVPSVVHAVPPSDGQVCDLDTFRRSLDRVEGPILGADVVEWIGAAPDTAEYRYIQRVLHEVCSRLGAA